MLPAEAREAMRSMPVPGAWEPMFPLLSVDLSGEPRICLLSAAEIDVDAAGDETDTVRCVVRSRRTTANLRRTGTAVLQVVGASTSWSLRCRVSREVVSEDGGLGVELRIVAVEGDSLGIPLRPSTFLAEAALAVIECWDSNAALLGQLAARKPG